MIGEFWQRLGRNRMLDVGMGFIALLALGRLAFALPSRVFEWDFAHYYVSSRLLLEGKDPYGPGLEAESERLGFVTSEIIPRATNPPSLLWLVATVAWAPPRAAFWMWTALQAMSLVVVLGLTRILLRGRLSARAWRFFCVGVISSSAIYYHFWFGQAQLLLVALVLGGFACAKRGHGTTACVLATAAGVVKLFPLVLVPWFVWRGGGGSRGFWRRASMVGATGLFLTAATGWKLWNDFFHFAPSIVNDFAPLRSFNFTVPSLVMNLYALTLGQGIGAAGLHEWWTVAEATGAVVMIVGYWLVWTRGSDWEAEFCLLCVAMLAGNPVTWGHYFVFLIFPMAVVAARLRGKWTGGRIVGFGSLLLALNLLDLAGRTWAERSLVLLLVTNYIPLAGVIALGCLFVAWLGPGGEGECAAPSPGR